MSAPSAGASSGSPCSPPPPAEAQPSSPVRQPVHHPDAAAVLAQIERILRSLHGSLAARTPLTIQLATRASPASVRTYAFPGRTPQHAHRFAALLQVLDAVYALLLTSRVITKRELFYQHAAVFRSQLVVDRIVDDVAATLGVPRSALNVVAGSKGLVAGDVRIALADGGEVDAAAAGAAGALIPRARDVVRVRVGAGVRWVLVVEKEAVFRALVADGAWTSEALLLTGKGYPDVSTREFLRLLADTAGVRVHALVDYDPYGVEILATYALGSIALAHESWRLAVDGTRWLGVRSGDVEDVVVGRDAGGGGEEGARRQQGLLLLSRRDRRKAVELMGREMMVQRPEWRRELQKMLFTGYKAEIEFLEHAQEAGMGTWITAKLATETDGQPLARADADGQ